MSDRRTAYSVYLRASESIGPVDMAIGDQRPDVEVQPGTYTLLFLSAIGTSLKIKSQCGTHNLVFADAGIKSLSLAIVDCVVTLSVEATAQADPVRRAAEGEILGHAGTPRSESLHAAILDRGLGFRRLGTGVSLDVG